MSPSPNWLRLILLVNNRLRESLESRQRPVFCVAADDAQLKPPLLINLGLGKRAAADVDNHI